MSLPTQVPDVTATVETEPYGIHGLDEKYMTHYSVGLEKTAMKPNVLRAARFFQMTQLLKLTQGIDGATAEAGCFRGLASFLICKYRKEVDASFDGTGHFMVDSFEGLSEPVAEDGELSKTRYMEGVFTRTSLEVCQNTLNEFPGASIIKGWIPTAFHELPDQQYRFVHIDVDIYQPTLDALQYFFPKMAPGGIIVVDDFGPWPGEKWPGCKIAVEQFSQEVQIPFAHLDTRNAMFIKR